MKVHPINKAGIPLSYVEGYDFPRIVAFSGKFGTGKDGAATMVRTHLIFGNRELGTPDQTKVPIVNTLKFADSLKRSCAEMTGMSEEDQYSAAGKAKEIPGLGMTVGKFQQILGTVARIQLHPDIWMLPVINKTRSSEWFVVISDCRFKNEAKAIQSLGGLVIRLNRPAHLISEESKAGRDPTHISETDLDDYPNFDCIIDNSDSDHGYLKAVMDFLAQKKRQ